MDTKGTNYQPRLLHRISAINPTRCPDACIPAWLAFLASPLSWASFGCLLTISRDSFKAHQIASLTTRRCTNVTNVDFLNLLVSVSRSYFLKGLLGCNPLNPLLPQSARPNCDGVCPPCLSLPSGPLPHRNRAAPKGPRMKN